MGTTIATIQGDITTEVSRATAAEGANSTTATNNYNTLDTAITAETTARAAADTIQAGDITANAIAITAEETRATAAEASLQLQISNLLSNTDGTALNSLAVDQFNTNGATYTASLQAQIDTFDAQKIVYDSQIATLQQQVYDLLNPP
jgi:hypothetical protein